jgi:predicted nucleotidyltransferase
MTATQTLAHQEIIAEMVRRIVEEFDPQKVILFGSYARGMAGPDSDVDLLVVMPVQGSRRQQRVAIRTALSGMGLAKDVFVFTPDEMERYGDLVGSIIRPALREGKVLYERPD